MSMLGIRTNLTLEDFEEALELLDSLVNEPVDLNVVGGFALMVHGLRSSGVTADIGTASPSFSREVEYAVEEVAERLNLPPDWLNNDSVFSFGDVRRNIKGIE